MRDECPHCPKCGTPARYVRGHAFVLIALKPNNSLGEVLRVSATMELPKREYVCGGNHRWILDAASKTP